jgi:hypothetical protein
MPEESIDAEMNDKARFLREQGDGGLGPNVSRKTYPRISGDGYEAQLWRAINGATFEDHIRSEAYKLAREAPKVFDVKRQARRKKGKNGVEPPLAEVSLADYELPCHLTKDEFFNLYGAIAFANCAGEIMNAHLTISWGRMGYEEHQEAAEALVTFTKRYRQWCRENELEAPFYVYVHENSEQIGFHTHFLTAVPPDRVSAFRSWLRGTMPSLSLVSPPPKGFYKLVAPPSRLLERQWLRFRYLCKGVDPVAHARSSDVEQGIELLSRLTEFEYEAPGKINCRKRVGTSANLGKTARKREGFQSLLERGVLDKRRLYAGEEYAAWVAEQSASENRGVPRLHPLGPEWDFV